MSAPNGLGINAFSGPMGEKEPAYGAIERMKVLSAIAPVGSPAAVNAPKRAKRAALRRGRSAPVGAGPLAPAPTSVSPDVPVLPQANVAYEQQLASFWQKLAAEPDASSLVKQYAAQVGNG